MAKKKQPRKQKTTRRKTQARSKTTRGGTSSRRKRSSTSKRSRSTRSKKPRRTPQEIRLSIQQKALVVGIAIVFLAVVLILSLLSPNQAQLTSALATLLWRLFGWGGAAVPVITAAVGLYLVLWGMEQPPSLPVYRLIGFGTLFLVLEAFATMGSLMRDNGLTDVWQVAHAEVGGGYLGGILVFGLTQLIGNLGTIFTLVIFGFIGAVLLSGVSRQDISHFVQNVRLAREALAEPAAPAEIPINPGRSPRQPVQRHLPTLEGPGSDAEASPPPPAEPAAPEPTPRTRRQRRAEPAAQPAESTEPAAPEPIFIGRHKAIHAWKLPDIDDILEAGSDGELNSASIREQVEIIEHTLESFGAPATVVEINQGPTITQFGVEPSFLEARSGKRTKVKVGKIASLSDDLALALAAHSIRIQAPVPGKGYVGIEVPNVAKALVSLRDVMEAPEFRKVKGALAIGLGQNVSGQPIAADLASMPHLLIAGTTGSGKSVCVNGIIACLLLKHTPDNLKLVMVDPKRVELTGYNGVPHLAAPVVVEMDRVIGTLQWALREMDGRYKRFAEYGARNIVDYNKKVARDKDQEALPYIVIIIDELADLMMLAPEDTERAVTRLAQMARATGIHMVIATQRPSVDVVTGIIKANFPARIAFAVASSTDSRVILDTTGAERLLGQGDMLFQSPDAAAPVRLQGCFVSDAELAKLIEYWRTARRFNLIPADESITPRAALRNGAQAAAPPTPAAQDTAAAAPPTPDAAPPAAETAPASPTPEPAPPAAAAESVPFEESPPPRANLTQRPLWEELQEMESDPDEPELEDELLPEAIALVRKLNKASTSLLQRRFRIGYTRAARLIDYMEDKGIIGPPTGTSKARIVLPAKLDEAPEPGTTSPLDDPNAPAA